MKKFIKVFLITIASFLVIFIAAICIAIWLVFTPEKLTPVVRKQADKYIKCQSEIGDVELTFFSTFPHFGIKINRFGLINPIAGASSDTLVNIEQLVGVVDVEAWRKNKDLIITDLILTNGTINVFTDSLGHTNYDITVADTTSPEPVEDSAAMFNSAEIRNVELNNVNVRYVDLAMKTDAAITDLTAKISGSTNLDSISGNLKVINSVISLNYGGENYLKNASLKFNIPVDVIASKQFVRLKEASLSINEMEICLDGTVENDTINKNINADLNYHFKSWPIKNILALVPPSYNSYLEGIDVDGLLSSDGTITGIYNDSVMPLMKIHLMMEDGTMKYSGFPLPLHDIEGDINFCSDLKTDSVSYVLVNHFSAKTPQSTFGTKGMVNQLFTNIFCDLTTDADLTLEEFNQMIPDSMKVTLKGKASGSIKSVFSLTQVEKMQVEKMRLSGSVTLSDCDFKYDSISLKTDRSKIDFALPNYKSSTGNTRFAFARIQSGNLEAGKIESYHALLQNANISVETSDARDTTRIPDFICSFNIDSLAASMDTLSLAVAQPKGKIMMSPRPGAPDQPKIRLLYNSNRLDAVMGKDMAEIKKINIDTDILNDNTQKDIFLQWVVKGFVDLEQGLVSMSALSHPLEIPSIKMNFEPEELEIKEGKIKIDKSDFQLSGNLRNVLSYFRGDSLLRGNFNFVSNNTDVSQLMSLTSGLGNVDSTATEKPDDSSADSTYTGPYMVPKGMDISLNANIKKASFGIDTASNIKGIVRVDDGILLLDGLSLETPAARMQLTAMYRTPRKNHLFLGIDYHLLDVEIGELLTMIPDIDSLMPMLRSFGGKGEFHIAVETYLDSLYNLKKSTLRGAASIKGNDLVLMDGETFSEIAKTLRFSKKAVNKVDSLSAEFTIFRNEIDVYPFLIVMDKYKAVIAGRHNFDMTFDYHISVVDCPLPIKLGIDIKGTPDDMKYALARCRYAEFYRPTSRHAVENKQLELRKLIRDALTGKVKE
ncbi:MAG TPA: AsmA-like C-terminal region-containing protein [Bacteroidales bacterium]|nr:AsmA-like C-terminal region-containing protein [Bacteroidales bacterium]